MFLAFLSYTRLSTSTLPIAGSVALGLTATSRIIRRFPRTATAVFARAISCASCSRLFFAQDCGRNRGATDNSDDCELSLVGSALRLNLAGLSVPRDAIWKIAYDYQSSEENYDHESSTNFNSWEGMA